MRKLFLLLTGLLLGGAVTAQDISHCEYWFDQNFAGRQNAYVVNGNLQWQADASALTDGLHFLYLHVQDTSGQWSSPRSFSFLHYPTPQSATATYTYWFDQEMVNSHSGTLADGNMMLDASMLNNGPHFLTMMCQIGTYIRVEQYLFMHIPTPQSATATYTYWFDGNEAGSQTDTLVNGSVMVDASSLTTGMHSFNIVCRIGSRTRVEQHLFYKMPAALEATALTFHYRVDNGNFQSATTTMQGTIVNLNVDMTAIDDGVHTIEFYTTNGNNDILSPLQTESFERTHIPMHYTLTAIAEDETMGHVDGGGSWVENTEVTINAIPNDNYHFTHWNDGDTINPRVITLTSDTTFTAYFEEDIHYYTLTVLSADETMGTVSEGGTWMENEQVTITAYPNNGYLFSHWNDDVTDNPRTITITCDTLFTAFFIADGGEGFDSPNAEEIIAYGYNGNIVIKLDKPKPVWVYDVKGILIFHTPSECSVSHTIPAFPGIYIVKAGESFIKKILITR